MSFIIITNGPTGSGKSGLVNNSENFFFNIFFF